MMKKGFTLIELLIVVAIIAILAAIAVPNFLEAQTRSKVSRAKSDLRTQATAVEAYFVDWNSYTRDSDSSLDSIDIGLGVFDTTSELHYNVANGALQLTTPVPYITSLLEDPFAKGDDVKPDGGVARGYRIGSGSWAYGAWERPQNLSSPTYFNSGDNQSSNQVFEVVGKRNAWMMISVGPDQARCRIGYKCFPFQPNNNTKEGPKGADGTDIIASKEQPGCYTDYDPTNGTLSIGDIYRFGGDWNNGRFNRNGEVIGSPVSPDGGSVVY